MNKKTTLQDIAAKAHISTAAVSMILSGKKLSRFSQETRDNVYAIAHETGYKAKHGTDKDGIIVIVCPSVINPYYATLLQGMELEAEKNGYTTIIFNTYWNIEREKKIMAFANNPAVRGLIFSMIPQQPELADTIAETLPVVTVGDKQDALQLDTVEVNNFDAGYQMGKHLITLGHRHVCYVSTSLNKQHSSRVLRYKGLCESYKSLCPEGTVSLLTSEVDPLRELSTVEIEHQTGKMLAKKCIQLHDDVTAIVAINDMVAYGVIDEIIEEGFHIPEDFSVCGFDNVYPSQFSGVSLTTIDHFINQRGQSAFSLMQAKLEHKDREQHTITYLEFRNQLIVRRTTGKPRQLPVKL
jgi:LacI family transcriptional regulator